MSVQVVSSRAEEQRKLSLHGYIRARSVRALLYVEVGFPESVISCNNEWYWKLDSWCILVETKEFGRYRLVLISVFDHERGMSIPLVAK